MSLSPLFVPRVSNRFKARHLSVAMERIVVAFALALYAGILAYLIPRHEAWVDEAQAWELAKSLSLKSLFGTYIHYECSPGLWHFLLWLLARLHVTYYGMHWLTGAVALISVAILLLKAPFQLWVRIFLPFTYFFVFQYAIVARSYVLFPAILFAIACVWQQRRQHPIALSFLLGLLANVALHGTVVAIGLGLIVLLEWRSVWNVEPEHQSRRLVAAALFSVMLGFALWCLVPAPDAGWLVVARQLPSNVSTEGARIHPWMQKLPLYLLVVLSTLHRFVHVLDYGFTLSVHLGILAWALLLWRLHTQGRSRFFLPVIFLAISCMYSRFPFYHAGLFWILFLFVWWVTWPYEEARLGKGNWIEMALVVVVVCCIATQLVWAVRAVRYDVSMPYSPSRDAAVILQRYLRQGIRVDVAVASRAEGLGPVEYFITHVEPYFTTEPIKNKPYRFWFWGADDGVRAKYLADSDRRAVVVVVEEIGDGQYHGTEEGRLSALGYRRANVVCGQAYYPDNGGQRVCDAFYEPPIRQGRTP